MTVVRDLNNVATTIDTDVRINECGKRVYMVMVDNDYDMVTYETEDKELTEIIMNELIAMLRYKDDVLKLNAEIYARYSFGTNFSYEMV